MALLLCSTPLSTSLRSSSFSSSSFPSSAVLFIWDPDILFPWELREIFFELLEKLRFAFEHSFPLFMFVAIITFGFTFPSRSSGLDSKHFNGLQLRIPLVVAYKIDSLVVKAASETDGTSLTENNERNPTAENKKEAIAIEKLPLESKVQERMEQKTRMKLAKKIRLRRNRLVRKRRLRKKGRWPPSKMKKLKNV